MPPPWDRRPYDKLEVLVEALDGKTAEGVPRADQFADRLACPD